jgi:hypothetical protein
LSKASDNYPNRCKTLKKLKIIKHIFGIILFSILSTSCINESNQLYQTWVPVEYKNDSAIYESKWDFDENKSGIEFNSDGTLKYKRNGSYCGTPPITYEIVSGNWNSISDSLLELNIKPKSKYKKQLKDTFKIVEISKSKLVLKRFTTQK